MTFPKNCLFTIEDQALAQVSFALQHPARLFIVRTLKDEGPKFVQELEEMMPLVQSSISYHLQILRKVHLLQVEEQGLSNCYILDMQRMEELSEVYEAWFKSVKV
jgi:ArsR family transcriptional regulator, arsenate/arsenite/antimonite-responsive transcriptional repressor